MEAGSSRWEGFLSNLRIFSSSKRVGLTLRGTLLTWRYFHGGEQAKVVGDWSLTKSRDGHAVSNDNELACTAAVVVTGC